MGGFFTGEDSLRPMTLAEMSDLQQREATGIKLSDTEQQIVDRNGHLFDETARLMVQKSIEDEEVRNA